MITAGISPEQAPSLHIPITLFLFAPLATIVAGVWISITGVDLLTTGWAPPTIGLSHIATLGMLAPVMFGAIYQLIPVVGGAPVPWPKLAPVMTLMWLVGVVGLISGFAGIWSSGVLVAIWCLGPAIFLFAIPSAFGIARTPRKTPTVIGLGLAICGLLLTATFGLWMAHGHAAMNFPGPRPLWIQVHLGLGLLNWVGALLIAASWQLVPMFYLTPAPPQRVAKGSLAALMISMLLTPASLFFPGEPWARGLAFAAAAPAGLAIWVVHPLWVLQAIRTRRRKRVDGSLEFWRLAMPTALLLAPLSIATWQLGSPKFGILFIWLAVWGWAGAVIHGMLTRIVPFLIWFHRFSHLVGRPGVPSMRDLQPDKWTRRGFWAHLVSLILGAAAITTGLDPLCRATGVAVAGVGAHLLFVMLHLLRQRADHLDRSLPGG